jgi:hypothetical protein
LCIYRSKTAQKASKAAIMKSIPAALSIFFSGEIDISREVKNLHEWRNALQVF